METYEPLSYALRGVDRFRWTFASRRKKLTGLVLALFFAAQGSRSLVGVIRNPHNHVVLLALLALLLPMLLACAVWMGSKLRRVDRMSLTFGPKCLELSCNGATERVAWYAVGGASSFPRFFAIERRDDWQPILIPRAAVRDPDALWSFLEVRLQGSASKYFPAPAGLLNRADRYLADRAADSPAGG